MTDTAAAIRIISFSREPDGSLCVYDIFELDRGTRSTRFFFRQAMLRFRAGYTDRVMVGSCALPWQSYRVAAQRGAWVDARSQEGTET